MLSDLLIGVGMVIVAICTLLAAGADTAPASDCLVLLVVFLIGVALCYTGIKLDERKH